MNPNHTECVCQRKRIINYLKSGNSITGLEALNLFGCMSLPKRICEIIEEGYKVERSFVHLDNGKKVMRYWFAFNELK